MNYEQLIKHFGSQTAIARALSLSSPSVWEWQTNGIPDERQLEIERLTDGKLKADARIVAKYKALLTGKAA